jgi:protein TonB
MAPRIYAITSRSATLALGVALSGCGASAPPVEAAREGSYLQWVQSQADASSEAEPAPPSAPSREPRQDPNPSTDQELFCSRDRFRPRIPADGGVAFGAGNDGQAPMSLAEADARLDAGLAAWARANGIQRPTRIAGSPPTYTKEAFKAGVHGDFVAKCTIAEDGSLENCCVVRGLPFMNQALIRSLYTWRYTPVTFEGHPVKVDYVITIHLKPPNEAKPPP